ncbi:MAG: ABC-2 family transporter protein [Treponema sp.]|nr:ABC-2 family transporter protein [Treponema sp.]
MIFAYGQYILMVLKERANFRIDFCIFLITGFFSSYAHVAIWMVIMAAVSADPAAVSRTIQYIVLTGFVADFINAPDRDPVFIRVQNGDIARELIYPVSFPLTVLSRGLGNSLFRSLVNGLLTILVMSLIFRISWRIGPEQLVLFVLFLSLGFLIQFLISFQVDMLAFWVYETTALHYIKGSVVDFFSGRLVPLWFYPPWILGLLDILPFKSIVYVPIAFLIGELPLSAVPAEFGKSLAWCVFFTLTASLMWRAGVRKTVINGG